jgi:membrane-bound lytic murein transglycosylase D
MAKKVSNFPSTVPAIQLRLQEGSSWSTPRRFVTSFRIGRSRECDIVLSSQTVSKLHAQVRLEDGHWWLCDLKSRNGTYLNGNRVDRIQLPPSCHVELGRGGTMLWIGVGDKPPAPEPAEPSYAQDVTKSITQFIRRLKGKPTGEDGSHTQYYREALQRIVKHQSRRYQAILVILALLLFGTAGLAIHQHNKLQQLRETAGEIFYAMKQKELRIAQLEEMVATAAREKEMRDILAERQDIKSLESKYDNFMKDLGIYSSRMSEQDRAVFRMARLFGECEATMPEEFLTEVKKYIKLWQTTDRLAAAMRKALTNGYTASISNAMFTRNLPPQYFYVALQESGFDPKAIGPKTRMGYAKGMWQFLASTANEFGLKTGPLQHAAQFDPDDERFDPKKATDAAAKYIKRIYLTDAQASGLLVMASYNWGEGNVIRMINQLPKNPQDRNFWQLRKKFTIPQETRDYVFYIISAAVIGENPQLFGFNFPPPFPSTKQL